LGSRVAIDVRDGALEHGHRPLRRRLPLLAVPRMEASPDREHSRPPVARDLAFAGLYPGETTDTGMPSVLLGLPPGGEPTVRPAAHRRSFRGAAFHASVSS